MSTEGRAPEGAGAEAKVAAEIAYLEAQRRKADAEAAEVAHRTGRTRAMEVLGPKLQFVVRTLISAVAAAVLFYLTWRWLVDPISSRSARIAALDAQTALAQANLAEQRNQELQHELDLRQAEIDRRDSVHAVELEALQTRATELTATLNDALTSQPSGSDIQRLRVTLDETEQIASRLDSEALTQALASTDWQVVMTSSRPESTTRTVRLGSGGRVSTVITTRANDPLQRLAGTQTITQAGTWRLTPGDTLQLTLAGLAFSWEGTFDLTGGLPDVGETVSGSGSESGTRQRQRATLERLR